MVSKDRAARREGAREPEALDNFTGERDNQHTGDASGADGAMKVVARHERPRGAASRAEIRGSPNGATPRPAGLDESTAVGSSPKRGTETSQYPRRESVSESRSSGERTGTSPNARPVTGHTGGLGGLWTCVPAYVDRSLGAAGDPKLLECSARAGESPVGAPRRSGHRILSTSIPVKDRGKPGGPPPKTPDHPSPIAQEYREGTVKSPPGGE